MKYRYLFAILLFFACVTQAESQDSIHVPLPPKTANTVTSETEITNLQRTEPVIAKIVKPAVLVPGGLVKLLTDGSQGTVFGWSIPENLPNTHYYISADQRTLIVSSASAGTYFVGFFASDGQSVSIDRMTVVVGDGVDPSPAPPPPTPTPSDDSLSEWIIEALPEPTSAMREQAGLLASVYEKVAEKIDAGRVVNGSQARDELRNDSLDALLTVASAATIRAEWKPVLDGLFERIEKKTAGPDDLDGLAKSYRDAAMGFRAVSGTAQAGSPHQPTGSRQCQTPNCKIHSSTKISPAGYQTNSPNQTQHGRRLISR